MISPSHLSGVWSKYQKMLTKVSCVPRLYFIHLRVYKISPDSSRNRNSRYGPSGRGVTYSRKANTGTSLPFVPANRVSSTLSRCADGRRKSKCQTNFAKARAISEYAMFWPMHLRLPSENGWNARRAPSVDCGDPSHLSGENVRASGYTASSWKMLYEQDPISVPAGIAFPSMMTCSHTSLQRGRPIGGDNLMVSSSTARRYVHSVSFGPEWISLAVEKVLRTAAASLL